MTRRIRDVVTGELREVAYDKPDWTHVMTAEEKAQRATEAADRLLGDAPNVPPETVALGLVLADLIERAFGVPRQEARAQVKSRVEQYTLQILNR